jgi:hypothetical protein
MTANPRTKIVTDYDVEKLADNYGRLHGCYFLPHQNACELCKREAADFLASLPDAPTPEAIAKQEQDVETLNEIAGWLRNLVYTNDATADQAENYACDLEILASPPDAPPSAPEAAPRGELPTRGAFLARVSELCTSHPDCLAAPFSNQIETAWRLAFLELQGAIP